LKLPDNLISGADNLLLGHMGLKAGESCLLVLEPDEQLYERKVGEIIEARCRELGAYVTVETQPLIAHAEDFPVSVANTMRHVDHTLFLSRLGDYVRFIELPGRCTKTTCYTYNTRLLASHFASIPSTLMTALRDKLEAELLLAKHWRITCPLGSDLSGEFNWASLGGGSDDELQVSLFPITTFKPVSCDTASGSVALSRWLMPGGATKVENANLKLQSTVHCEVESGMIKRFYGCPQTADKISRHYDHVASTLGINRNRVHSWHLGINPQTFFPASADDNLDKWCAISFGSPRYLHFHTCGDEPPGEIAWSLFNCCVYIDDKTYWENGEFSWLWRDDNRTLIERYPGAEMLLQPSCCIGL